MALRPLKKYFTGCPVFNNKVVYTNKASAFNEVQHLTVKNKL